MTTLADATGDALEQLRWERSARELLQQISVAASESLTVADAIRTALDLVCQHTGWPVGHALTLDAEGWLISTRLWHLGNAARFERFREVSEAHRFAPGVGLPGRVLATGQPAWIADVMQDSNFPRAKLMQEHSVRAGFACPVRLRPGVVTGVLEFFSSDVVAPNPPLLEVMAVIGVQIGRVIERARAEDALRQSELRLRSVAETANDAIISADSQGLIVSWNPRAQQMFGYTAAEVAGQPLTLIMPERFHHRHEAGIARVRSGGPRHVIGRTVELQGRHRDGHEIPLELSLATWTVGEEAFFTGILRDITERKVQEEQLREASQRLSESERRAVEASRAKSVFLANMSHELRTPLNAILGFVQLLERDPALNAGQRDDLRVVLRSGEHLRDLINNVLSMAKVEAGRATLDPVDFDLAHLVEHVADLLRPRARHKGLDLTLAGEGLPSLVHGDEGKLRQVLFNLLGNAIKFTDAGAVALRVSWRDGTGVFAVEDTGPGIAPADQARVFEPFVQVEGSTHAEGTGLGLSISRDFVALMGGALSMVSEPGRGTRIGFELPLPAGRSGAPRAASRRVVGLAPGQPERRLLIVEDDPASRTLLSRLLAQIGFSPRDAADGHAGLALWEEWQPDLVWMDVRMPGIDGLTATRRIRAREAETPTRGRTVVVALTASAFDHHREALLEAGCDEVLTKPFREEEVFEVLHRCLGVELLYADEPVPSDGGGLDTLQLTRLPPGIRDQLREALVAGDDDRAQQALAPIAGDQAALAQRLGEMIRRFEFDEILNLLERSWP